MLLLGTLGRPGQEALLQRHPELRADIVVTGLPQRGEAVSDALIEQLRPRAIVIADSDYPATTRASPALHARLGQYHIPILYGREVGAVTLRLRNGQTTVEPLLEESFTLGKP